MGSSGSTGQSGKGGGNNTPQFTGYDQYAAGAEERFQASQAQRDNRINNGDGTGIGLPNSVLSGGNFNASQAGRAGIAAGSAALGTALLGPMGGIYAGFKGAQSARDGALGDLFNVRTNEGSRDFLERQGISRGDTALAAKHGIINDSAVAAGFYSVLDNNDDDDGDTGVLGGDSGYSSFNEDYF